MRTLHSFRSVLAPSTLALALALALGLGLGGCGDEHAFLSPGDPAGARLGGPVPVELVTLDLAGGELTFWPYINFAPEERPHDPVNLIFTGHADARNVRAALMGLDGSRPGPFADFDCTWTDAIGSVQVSWAANVGWTASVVQLECGDYGPFRFHIRLFPAGPWTLANAHVEILIPGTEAHQVLNWEVAEQLIIYELARAGILGAAPETTARINQAPFMDEIPVVLYNMLPPHLRALAGGPQEDVDEPVGIYTNGHATVLNLAVRLPDAPGTEQSFVLPYGQFVPKPFCAEPGEMVRVDGPLALTQVVTITANGDLASEMIAHGDLVVRPVTATGLGDPIPARVREQTRAELRDDGNYATADRHQRLIPGSGPVQQLKEQLRVGPNGLVRYRSDEICGR